MKIIRKILPPILPFAVLFLGLEYLVRTGIVPNYLLPAPSQVFQSLQEDGPEYFAALSLTLTEALLGLLLSTIFGIATSIIFSTSRFAESALYPYAVFFQTVPIISIAPLLVIWFGFGFKTVVVSA